jgi:hypothetical protein
MTRRTLAIAAIIATTALTLAACGSTTAKVGAPIAKASLTAPQELQVTCNGHLSEVVQGSPYLLNCANTTPPVTTTTRPPTTTTVAPTTTLPVPTTRPHRHHPTTTTSPVPTTQPVTPTTKPVTPTTKPVTPTTTPVTPTTTPSGSVFRLFAPSSLWNTIKTSDNFVASANSTIQGISFGLNNGDYDHPFYIATASDPMTTFKLGAGWGHDALTVTAPAPSGMAEAAGGDADMDVLLPAGTNIGGGWGTTSGRWLLDMYGVSGSGTNWTAAYYGLSDGLDGPGFGGPPTYSAYYAIGTTAVGSPQAEGTILASDVAAGTIPHGLTMACDYGYEGNSPSGDGDELSYADGPAVSNDDGGGGGPLSEGSLLLIPPNTAVPSGLSAMGRQLWNAAATYGVYITDQAGGGCYFYGDGSSAVDNAFNSNDFQIVGQALELVNTWGANHKTLKEAPKTAPKEFIQPAPCPAHPKSAISC